MATVESPLLQPVGQGRAGHAEQAGGFGNVMPTALHGLLHQHRLDGVQACTAVENLRHPAGRSLVTVCHQADHDIQRLTYQEIGAVFRQFP